MRRPFQLAAGVIPALLIASYLAMDPAPAAEPNGNPAAALNDAVIADFLKRHPEAVVDALKAAEAQQQDAELAQARTAIAEHGSELTQVSTDPVAGNPRGDVTVVEFFDFQCPYCKSMASTLQQAVRKDPNLRVVYKDIPILGPASLTAARAALAARAQGKYVPFHEKLMASKGQLTTESILQTADEVGLDVGRLKRDMADASIDAEIHRNLDLARTLKIRGTPAVIVGDKLAPGAIELDDLQRMIAQARKG